MSTAHYRQAGRLLAEELIRAAQAASSASLCAGLSREVVKKLDAMFAPLTLSGGLAAGDGRGDQKYWRDHGKSTGALMRRMAKRWGGDPELYYRVGFVHDLDYLRFPHDAPRTGVTDPMHPVPLACAMRELGVHPAVALAVLEHAPYLGLSDAPSSRLSAALSAAEDLATIAALDPPFKGGEKLSEDAQELLGTVKVRKRVHRTRKVRVEVDPERYVNTPLAQFISGRVFRFDF